MNMSFFAKQAGWSNRLQRLTRGSSLIRGEQIAKYLGAKLNPPAGGYENDICIYVKPRINAEFAKHAYIDVLDQSVNAILEFNKLHLPIIVSSLSAWEFFSKECQDNKIVFIPQHHCNYERFKRKRQKVTTVGILGYHASFMHPLEDVRERLKKIGMKLLVENVVLNRWDAVNFYKKIDLQITWVKNAWIAKNPLKLYNAASFGIPTVGYKQQCYKEFEGCYIPVQTMDEMIEKIAKLKEDKKYYAAFSKLITLKAEKYHISKIAKLYRELT